MPSFDDFDYYFAIDELHIPASWIAIQFIWVGFFILVIPIIYVTFLKDIEYSKMFFMGQALYCYSFFGKYALVSGWTQQTGIPNFMVYFLVGAFVGPLERSLKNLPGTILLAKMIPKGVESTLKAVSGTIMGLDSTIRSQIGLAINDKYVHVTKHNIKDYPCLARIEAFASLLPFLFIYCLVPTMEETD